MKSYLEVVHLEKCVTDQKRFSLHFQRPWGYV